MKFEEKMCLISRRENSFAWRRTHVAENQSELFRRHILSFAYNQKTAQYTV